MACPGPEVLERIFACPRPPHELVAYVFLKILARGVAEIVSGLSDIPLRRLVDQIARTSNPGESSSQQGFPSGPGPLRATMALPFGEAVRNRKARHVYRHLRLLPVGDTTLRNYYGPDPVRSIASWCEDVEEAMADAPLLARAQAGDLEAAEALFLRHAPEVRQAIRRLAGSAKDAQKVELGVRGRIFADIAGLELGVQSFRDFAKASVFPAFQAHFGRSEPFSRTPLPPATFVDETQDEALDRLQRDALRRGRQLLSAPPAGPDAGLYLALKTEREITLLWATFSGVNPPHHATVVLIGTVFRRKNRKKEKARVGKADAKGTTKGKVEYWQASQIVQRISHVSLRRLAHFFLGKFLKQSRYTEEILRTCFAPYIEQMDAPVASFLTYGKTNETFSGPADALAGETHFRLYFTEDPEDNIAKWRYSAKRRTLKLIFALRLGHLFER